MGMWSATFWKSAAERAVKTAGEFGLVAVGGNVVSAWTLDWMNVAGVMAAGAAVSVLTSLASIAVGDKGTASMVRGGH